MVSINAITLANYILATNPDHSITPLKLQKLAYYTKVWTLVAGIPIINATFKKWEYGPVNTAIFHAYKQYGSSPIPSPAEKDGQLIVKSSSKNLIHFIIDNYINYSAFELSAMTHNDPPWINTPHNQAISDQALITYYTTQPFAKNFSNGVPANGLFHVLQTESWHAFTLDMLPNDVKSMETYPSYNDYRSQSQQAGQEFESLMGAMFDEY